MSADIALCPRPRPSTAPAAIAMTFLRAPPISTPGDVVADVEAQAAPAEVLLHARRRAGIARGRQHRGGQSARDFGREARPGEHDDGEPRGRLFGNHLRHPRVGLDLESLRGAHDDRRATR